MAKIALEKKAVQWLVLIFLSFIWGSSFILIKKGLQSFHNFHVAGFRILFSYLLTLPISIKHVKQYKNGYFLPLLIVGLIGTAVPNLLFATAQQVVDSSLAGMLNSLTPFSTLVIGLIFYKSKVKIVQIIGVLAGLFGASMLVTGAKYSILGNININALLIVLATLCYGINVNEVKNKLAALTGMQITALSLFLVGPLALLYMAFSDYSYISDVSLALQSMGYLFILAAFSSVLAIVILNNLIKHTTAVFAASVTYIIPIFAIFWGVIDGETVSVAQFGWIAIILIGVYLVNKA